MARRLDTRLAIIANSTALYLLSKICVLIVRLCLLAEVLLCVPSRSFLDVRPVLSCRRSLQPVCFRFK
jgi:hypothetical protein